MSGDSETSYSIDSAEKWRVIGHPDAQRIFGALSVDPGATAERVGEITQLATSTIYRHLNHLQLVGVVVREETAPTESGARKGGKPPARFRLRPKVFEVPTAFARQLIDAMVRLCKAVGEDSVRRFECDGDLDPMLYQAGMLSEEEIAEVEKRLQEIRSIYLDSKGGTIPHHVVALSAPLISQPSFDPV